jgi:hypothetical protein
LGRAEELAGTITDPWSRAQALVAIVQAGGPPELLSRAEEVAYTITDPWSRAHALMAIVRAMAARPELLGRAEEVAGTITKPKSQAEALVSIAQAGGQQRIRHTALTLVLSRLVNAPDTTSWFGRLPAAVSVLQGCDFLDVIHDLGDAIIKIDKDLPGASTQSHVPALAY